MIFLQRGYSSTKKLMELADKSHLALFWDKVCLLILLDEFTELLNKILASVTFPEAWKKTNYGSGPFLRKEMLKMLTMFWRQNKGKSWILLLYKGEKKFKNLEEYNNVVSW